MSKISLDTGSRDLLEGIKWNLLAGVQ
jgi:hypothetical protein